MRAGHRSLCLFALLVVAWAAPAPSQAVETKAPSFLKARGLLDRCDVGRAWPDYCFAYVASVYDTVRAYESWLGINDLCIPIGTTQADLVKAAVAYIKANPAQLDSQAASVVVVALQNAFPCSAGPTADKPGATRSVKP